jgi:hypothetical protein
MCVWVCCWVRVRWCVYETLGQIESTYTSPNNRAAAVGAQPPEAPRCVVVCVLRPSLLFFDFDQSLPVPVLLTNHRHNRLSESTWNSKRAREADLESSEESEVNCEEEGEQDADAEKKRATRQLVLEAVDAGFRLKCVPARLRLVPCALPPIA